MCRFTEQIDAGLLHLRQFHIEPTCDPNAGDLLKDRIGGALQQYFQNGVVFVHLVPSVIP